MIIGAHVRHAAPFHPAGAEWTIHDAMSWLANRGHDTRILSEHGSTRERIDDVMIYSQPEEHETAQHWRECDVMLTQLDATQDAQFLAAEHDTPLIHMIHSEHQLEQLGVVGTCSALVVFNSDNVAALCDWWPGQSVRLHPPIDAERVKASKPGACVTMVNLSHNKGGMAFWFAADALPDYPFLGVMGAYEEQAVTTSGLPGSGANPASQGPPANMRVSPITPDIARGAFDWTRILLVLSMRESYGRIAAEAMISGIPVIATRTPGLVEACGDAAIYVDRDDPQALHGAIKRVYRDEWDAWSQRAHAQAEFVWQRSELELRRFEAALMKIHDRKPRMTL